MKELLSEFLKIIQNWAPIIYTLSEDWMEKLMLRGDSWKLVATNIVLTQE